MPDTPVTTPEPIEVCRLDDLPPGASRGFAWEAAGRSREGFVVRDETGVYAYLNVCPHAGHPLNWKPDAFLSRRRDLIMCSVHGAIFEIGSGLCVGGPCPGRSLQSLRVEVRRDRVLVYPPGPDHSD